nr:B3 domain-containing protein Os03g0212300-like [Aegilops tauschii subsp. strangulata]
MRPPQHDVAVPSSTTTAPSSGPSDAAPDPEARWEEATTTGYASATLEYELEGFEFFMIILDNSSKRHRLPDTFMEMLDGHRPKNVKLRQAGSGLHRLWDVEVVIRNDHMYLCRGWEQFIRAYDLRHGYFLVFRYDGDAMLTVKVFNTTMCRMRYQDDDDASYSGSDSGYRKSSS